MAESEIKIQGAPAPSGIATPYSTDAAMQIKTKIREIWERVKKTKGLTQIQLSMALGLSQGAISKLLANDNTHPWTIQKIAKFCEFCRVSIDEVVEDPFLRNFFTGWSGDRALPTPELMEESFSALTKFFADHGRSPSRTRLEALAAKVAVLVSQSDRKLEDFERAINNVILDEAGRN